MAVSHRWLSAEAMREMAPVLGGAERGDGMCQPPHVQLPKAAGKEPGLAA